MAFAGLWDAWKAPQRAVAAELHHHHYRTTDVKELMAPVHDRMPVILHPSDFDRESDPARPPFPADEMEAFEVAKEVGNVKNNGTELLNSK